MDTVQMTFLRLLLDITEQDGRRRDGRERLNVSNIITEIEDYANSWLQHTENEDSRQWRTTC